MDPTLTEKIFNQIADNGVFALLFLATVYWFIRPMFLRAIAAIDTLVATNNRHSITNEKHAEAIMALVQAINLNHSKVKDSHNEIDNLLKANHVILLSKIQKLETQNSELLNKIK